MGVDLEFILNDDNSTIINCKRNIKYDDYSDRFRITPTFQLDGALSEYIDEYVEVAYNGILINDLKGVLIGADKDLIVIDRV